MSFASFIEGLEDDVKALFTTAEKVVTTAQSLQPLIALVATSINPQAGVVLQAIFALADDLEKAVNTAQASQSGQIDGTTLNSLVSSVAAVKNGVTNLQAVLAAKPA